MSVTLPETHQVLLDHLLAKIRHIYPGQEEHLIQLVAKGLSNNEIMELLQSDQELEDAAQTMLSYQKDTSATLEETVFARVSQLDSELCAQLTGMLLELPPLRLARLLQDGARLKEAVSAARAEYLRFTGAAPVADSATQEELAEQLFAVLRVQHPELAGQLTGMLLELPADQLHALLTDPELLQLRTAQALRALER